ncbi:MAG: hypothetical protein ACREBI_05130 [Nitrosotalea sp.]
MTGLKDEDIEKESLKDLKAIVENSKEWGVEAAVIGGYAVRAFTNAYRHTKDIDMVIAKEEKGRFTALLKSLDYELRDTEFGMAASKPFDSDFIDVHISVGNIYDMSSGKSYPVTQELFNNKKIMLVGTKYEINKEFETKSPIVDLDTLIILKLIPKGRPEKDAIDIMSLIIDRIQEISIPTIVKKCKETGFTDYIRSQIQEFATKVNTGEMDHIWSTVTGTAMIGARKKGIQQFFRDLDSGLKNS